MNEFYFNEVCIERDLNPHGIMDFELATTRILKLFIDGTKQIDKSSISLNKRELPFPSKIEWDIKNDSVKRVPLKIEMVDALGNILNSFWMTITPLSTTNARFNHIPSKTEKINIVCYRENVIGKKAILTITARN